MRGRQSTGTERVLLGPLFLCSQSVWLFLVNQLLLFRQSENRGIGEPESSSPVPRKGVTMSIEKRGRGGRWEQGARGVRRQGVAGLVNGLSGGRELIRATAYSAYSPPHRPAIPSGKLNSRLARATRVSTIVLKFKRATGAHGRATRSSRSRRGFKILDRPATPGPLVG